MDLQGVDRLGRAAVQGIGPRRPGEACDRCNAIRVLAGHPVRHEPTVRVADEKDASGIDGELRFDLVQHRGEERYVVHRAAAEVAARIGRVPELIAKAIGRTVRMQVEEPLL
ncbi:MAG: hypothetical protein O7A63_11020, partial [Acidobacteria bacterium]|nr:hypothetical protein [Acidobacteriota bacterium]